MLVRNVRLVQVGGRPAPDGLVDLELSGGRIVAIRPAGSRAAGLGRGSAGGPATHPATTDPAHPEVLDADGRWAMPGLWDGHAHLGQWAASAARLDLRGTRSAAEAAERVGRRLGSGAPLPATGVLVGWGHRSAVWPEAPTTRLLDSVSGGAPVVLVSGDAHHGWLNSAALRRLGLPPRDDVLEEDAWFAVFGRLASLPGAEAELEAGYRAVLAQAAAMGVVGAVDLEFGDGFRAWPRRLALGLDALRIRAGVYPELLDEVIAAGLRTGDPLPGGPLGSAEADAARPSGRAVMGPLKVITDGSLSTRTAYCSTPYADALGGPAAQHPRGVQNYPPDALVPLVARATRAGLTVALHAIGDAALDDVLDAFEATGARGSVEHAQLVRPDEVDRMARLGIVASVQPAHLLDDRDVAEVCWADRTAWCFPFRDFMRAGVRLRLGSDAPVSPLDPWLAMAAAVHRSADARSAWHPEQALTAAEALAASTDGRRTLAAGAVADIALLDDDPLAPAGDAAEAARRLREMRVWATVMGGRLTHHVGG